jgi:hypothetical protein
MKKSMTFAALFAAITMLTACDKEDVISESSLPRESRTFLKTHFDGVRIASVVREVDGLEKEYSVWLENGFEINFTRSGDWDEIEGYRETMPASVVDLLPVGIDTWIAGNYPDRPIVKINRERWGYEIGLQGNVELDFTEAGEFLRYDD